MLRLIGTAIRANICSTISKGIESITLGTNAIHNVQYRSLSFLTQKCINSPATTTNNTITSSESSSNVLLKKCQQNHVPVRTLTKFSLQKGKRKTVKAVIRRFKRLHWGGWIRTLAGKHRYVWRKSDRERVRAKQHFLCNGQQSWMLDIMVNEFWRRPKYYVDDPYTPYHTRNFKKCRETPFD